MVFFDEFVNVFHTLLSLGDNRIPATFTVSDEFYFQWELLTFFSFLFFFFLLGCEHSFNTNHKFGRLKLCRKTMQLTRPRACTTSSFTLAVAVAVKANTGVFWNFCFKIPRPWTFCKTA